MKRTQGNHVSPNEEFYAKILGIDMVTSVPSVTLSIDYFYSSHSYIPRVLFGSLIGLEGEDLK